MDRDNLREEVTERLRAAGVHQAEDLVAAVSTRGLVIGLRTAWSMVLQAKTRQQLEVELGEGVQLAEEGLTRYMNKLTLGG